MSGQPVSEESITLYTGGNSRVLTLSAASAVTTVINNSKTIYVVATVPCWVRQGPSGGTVAMADGTDQYIPANTPMRLAGFKTGNVLAAIAGGAGFLYLTPEI